ncbi:hypothetical protein BC829DRAFT_268387 [Chytridium lagenaria]|nr:hypothetical protein BC829DRAFT_268387 [Chytridium lagenaria]
MDDRHDNARRFGRRGPLVTAAMDPLVGPALRSISGTLGEEQNRINASFTGSSAPTILGHSSGSNRSATHSPRQLSANAATSAPPLKAYEGATPSMSARSGSQASTDSSGPQSQENILKRSSSASAVLNGRRDDVTRRRNPPRNPRARQQQQQFYNSNSSNNSNNSNNSNSSISNNCIMSPIHLDKVFVLPHFPNLLLALSA